MVDGYSLSGYTLIGLIGSDYTAASYGSPLNLESTLKWSEMSALTNTPWAGTTGEWNGGSTVKSMNLGSISSITIDVGGTKKTLLFLMTSNEFYGDSGVVSYDGTLVPASGVALVATEGSTAFAKATYGQLWAIYAFKYDATTTGAITSQAANNLIFVG